jgi:general stress protein YciG
MKNKGRPENLKPLTTEKAREIGKKGGKASVKARKEKRLMSQIFAELLTDGLDIDIKKAAPKIIKKGGAPAVSLMKVISEATEGSKVNIDIPGAITIEISGVSPEPTEK